MNNKYLAFKNGQSAKSLALNGLAFYILPALVISPFLDLVIINRLSFETYFGSIIIFILAIFFYICIYTIAVINVLRFWSTDKKLNFSFIRKTFYFFVFIFPLSLTSHFISLYLWEKKFPEKKFRHVFMPTFFVLFLIGAPVLRIISSPLKKYVIGDLHPVDGSPMGNYSIKSYKSPKIGKKFTTEVPLILVSNYPKGRRVNSPSLIKADYELKGFRNNCGGCLRPQYLEKPLKMEFVPPGTIFTVTDSFKINGDIEYVLFTDNKGRKIESHEVGFELDVAGQSNFDDDGFYKMSKELEIWNHSKRYICVSSEFLNDKIILENDLQFSKKIENRLYKFIKDFALDKELSIEELSTANSLKDKCALINFKTFNSLALFFHHAEDWNIYSNNYEIINFDEKQSSESVNFDYENFIKKKPEEIQL